MVVYGAEFNGTLNAAIYLIKHQEFRECNLRVIYGLFGKTTPDQKAAKVFTKSVRTIATSNILSDSKSGRR